MVQVPPPSLALALLLQAAAGQERAEGRTLFADAGRRCEQPQLAAADDGTVALVCAVDGTSLRAALRRPDGAFGPLREIAALHDLAVGMRRGPRVAFAGDAVLVACIESRWDAAAKVSAGSGNLTVRRSTDGGATWSRPLRVNGEDGSAREGLHALAARGRAAVAVWLDPRGGGGAKLFAAVSSDGGATFGPDAPVWTSPSGSICPCCHPSACLDAAGNAVLSWRDAIDGDRDMFVGVLGPGAARVADPRRLGEAHWRLDACPMDGGGLALAGDRPVAVYRRQDTVFWCAGDGREQMLGPGRNAAVAANGTDALAVWERDGRVLCARLPVADAGARGAPDGLPAPAPPRAVELGPGTFAAVAPLPRGGFLVVAELRAGGGARITSFEL